MTTSNFLNLKIRCRACGARRHHLNIKVVSRDITPSELLEGTFIENFQFCGDRPSCTKTAQDWEAQEKI